MSVMKKFVALLLSMLIIGSGTIYAKTTPKSKSKTKTSVSSKSRKSNSKPTKASVLDLIKKSEEKELENGMTIVTYTFQGKYGNDNIDTDEIEVSVDWPVSGPVFLVEECRNFILKHLNTSSSNTDAIADYIWSLVQQTNIYGNEEVGEYGLHEGIFNINIMATTKITIISQGLWTNYSVGFDMEEDRKIFLNSNGKELTYAMFPTISKMRPLMLKHLENWDEPVTDFNELDWDVKNNLNYPSSLPLITSDNLVFQWDVSREENLSSLVPIKEILPLASTELRQFLVDDSDPTYNLTNENSNEVNTEVDQPAEFPGGQQALMRWLGMNIRYPEAAAQNGVQGRVVVRFIVEKDGSISNPEISNSVDKDLDKEAMRLVNKMPKWQPAKKNGLPARSYYNFPVTFKIKE